MFKGRSPIFDKVPECQMRQVLICIREVRIMIPTYCSYSVKFCLSRPINCIPPIRPAVFDASQYIRVYIYIYAMWN